MQLPPEAILASWPTPNYADPSNRGNANLIVNLTLFPLAFVFLLLRVYTRSKISKSFGLDDVFILLAIIPTTGFFVLAILVDVHYNIFRHTWDIPLSELSIQLQTNLAAECLFGAAFMFTKLSILQLIRRILEKTPSRTRVFVSITMGLCVLQGCVLISTIIFQCSPVSAYWTLSPDPQNCISEKTNLLAADLINTFSDLLVVLVPLLLIWNLHMPFRQLLVIACPFALGFIVVVAGVFRTVFFYNLGVEFDKTWVAYYVYLASEIELYTGVFCASILPIQPLFIKLFPTAYMHLFMSSDVTPTASLNTAYRTSTTPAPHQVHQAHLLRRQLQKRSNPRPPSRITVENKILIPCENMDDTAQEKYSNSDVDLESGLIKPHKLPSKKQRSRSQRKDRAKPDKPTSLTHQRKLDYFELVDSSPAQTTPQHIQYLKPPAKVVRIDIENQQIRIITPDSSSRCSSSQPSLASNTATASSIRQNDVEKKYRTPRTKYERENLTRKSSISTQDSGVTCGSRVVGIGVAMDSILTLPTSSQKNSNITSPSLSPRIIVEPSNIDRESSLGSFYRDLPNYTNEAYATVNLSNSSKSKSLKHQPGIPLPTKQLSSRDFRGMEDGDASPVLGFHGYRHIAHFMGADQRGGSLDTLKSQVDPKRTSDDSSLSLWQRSAARQSEKPRRDSPTLGALLLHQQMSRSVRRGGFPGC